ncbi:hypothetical protein MSG28_011560 [Choristoneura fumiferana]|uniref:Uncharacterized protein n=1 Tax=Choristoneura fumiferana TaxID=7141 RepID=A0ACC0JNV3_CHOFU|nr:hypothetical protein MSG28_011560 [Choristoneura fumiferana]
MSGLWNSIVGGNEKEVTWEEISQFYFDKGKKYFSVSERDKQETPIVYGEAHKITFNKTALGFTPLNFVSIYNIDTRKAEVKMPSGHTDKPAIEDNRDGTVSIKYEPREEGVHELYVKYNGEHVQGSPYKFHVDSIASGYVTAYGQGLISGVSGEPSLFTISTKGAGAGGLTMAVEGPSKAEAPSGLEEPCFLKRLPSGNIGISFTPREAGQHIVSVKKMGVHIQNSPFNITVQDQEVGDAKKVKVSGPSKAEIQCADSKDGVLNISYKPTEPGYYIVNLKFADHHVEGSPFTVTGEGSNRQREKIQRQRDQAPLTEVGTNCKLTFKMPGSPFQFTVGPLRDSGAHLVKAGGVGLERGEAGHSNEFNVWTREAGAGQLAISLEGPSKAEIDFKDRRDGSCDVSYKVDEPDKAKVYISPAIGDAHLLEVAQFPDAAQVDKPAQFYIRLNGAKGDLDARVMAPSGKTDDCFIQNIDGDQYSIRFMPRENGVHNINVKFNGVHIPASPLRIKVGKDDADPAAVHAHGPGLGAVKTGIKTDLIIDTCNAGAGGNLAEVGAQETSSVTVDTVLKVAKSGQKLGPVLPNFKSDASKVTSKGMGLKKAYLNKHNLFTIHAGDAGNNIMYVGIHGPKGPCDEVQLKHKGRNNYECSYVVRDRGEYILIVKWGDDHIPGSPYKVDV